MERKSVRLILAAILILANLAISNISVASSDSEGLIAETPTASTDSGDALESANWDLLRVDAPGAWQIVNGAPNIVVAILDTGIDDTHPDLAGTVINRVNFSHDELDRNLNAHGTFIAGIIASLNNGQGRTGIAYNSSLLDVKVADNDGTTSAQRLAQGIIWAVDQGADVINISIVVKKDYPLLKYAVDYAWGKGRLIVAAAGNNCSSTPMYPAAYSHVLGVAASDTGDKLTKWSNHGDWVSVAAPGVSIFSTLPGNGYGYKNGTSFSAALVTGEAALLRAQINATGNDTHINQKIYDDIVHHGLDISTLQQGATRIDILQAVKAEN